MSRFQDYVLRSSDLKEDTTGAKIVNQQVDQILLLIPEKEALSDVPNPVLVKDRVIKLLESLGEVIISKFEKEPDDLVVFNDVYYGAIQRIDPDVLGVMVEKNPSLNDLLESVAESMGKNQALEETSKKQKQFLIKALEREISVRVPSRYLDNLRNNIIQ